MFKEKKKNKFNLKINSSNIDPTALHIINKLNLFGFDAFLVGGCVRDLVMDKAINDWDIATQASVDEIINNFNDFKIVRIGEKHGTILLIKNHLQYQVSTFKSKKSFQTSLQSDLGCRDFTINSIAWNEKSGLVDLYNSMKDIRKGKIRFTESAQGRIEEDPLRMLRAIRLACELNFTIVESTVEGIRNYGEFLQKVSIERIRDEFIKILIGNDIKRGINLLCRLRLLKYILPELKICTENIKSNIDENKTFMEYISSLMSILPSDLTLRLSALLLYSLPNEDGEKKANIVIKILRRLKFGNEIIRKISFLTQEDLSMVNFSKKKDIRRLASKLGLENIENAWILKKGWILERQKYKKIKSIAIRNGDNNIRKTLQEKPPVCIKNLAVKGKDLIGLGYKEGKGIGEALKKMLQIVIENPELNEKKVLMKIFTKNKNNHF